MDEQPVLSLNEIQIKEKNIYLSRLENGVYHENVVESCACCGSNKAFLIGEKDRYGLPVKTGVCVECGLIFTLNPLDETSNKRFYMDQYRNLYEGRNIRDEKWKKHLDSLYENRALFFSLSNILPEITMLNNHSLVVEIGTGAGWNLRSFQKRGIPILGCDLDADLITHGNKMGIPIIFGSVKELIDQGIRSDLIILNHILEHTLNPVQFLIETQKILKPNGLIFIGAPGLRMLRFGEWGGDLAHCLQNAHNFLFELTTLTLIIKMAGLEHIYSNESIWSIFRNVGNNSCIQKSNTNLKIDSRGGEVIKYLRTLKYSRKFWQITNDMSGGYDSKTMIFIRRMIHATARRTGVNI